MNARAAKPERSVNAEPDIFDLEEYEGHPPRDEPGLTDWYSPFVFLGFGIIVLLQAFDLGIGSLRAPGTGLWPAINAVALMLMVPMALFARHRFNPPPREGLLRAFGVAVPMLVFVFLYDWVGLVGAGIITLFVITKFVGKMRWISALLTSILTPVLVYVIFGSLLGVSLRLF